MNTKQSSHDQVLSLVRTRKVGDSLCISNNCWGVWSIINRIFLKTPYLKKRKHSIKWHVLQRIQSIIKYMCNQIGKTPHGNFCLARGINPPRTSTISRGCAIYIKIIHLAAMINAAVFLLNVHLNVTYCIFMVFSFSRAKFLSVLFADAQFS